MILTIVFSNYCDLDCSYCCIGDKNKSPILSIEQTYKFIDEYSKPGENVIEFYGGEPSLHSDMIFQVVEYTRSQYEDSDKEFTFRLYTNGLFTNISDDDKIKLAKYIDEILVSLDGHTPEANKQRMSPEEFSICVENIKKICRYSHIGISSVLFGKHKYMNMYDSYLFFSSLGVKYFSYEPLTVYNDDRPVLIPANFLFKFVENMYLIMLDMIKYNVEGELFVAKELLSSKWYVVPDDKKCSSLCRAISPRENIYMCRDYAANEEKMFYSPQIIRFKNINKLEESYDNFQSILNSEGRLTPCVVKDNQYGDGSTLYWLDDDFQDLIIKPLYSSIIEYNAQSNLLNLRRNVEKYLQLMPQFVEYLSKKLELKVGD